MTNPGPPCEGAPVTPRIPRCSAWLLACSLAACGDPAERTRTFGGDRSVELQIPAMFDEDEAYPLVVVLHGYSITGYIQQAYLGLQRHLVDAGRAFVVAPTGT